MLSSSSQHQKTEHRLFDRKALFLSLFRRKVLYFLFRFKELVTVVSADLCRDGQLLSCGIASTNLLRRCAQQPQRVPKRILTEEEMSALSDKLMQVTKGMTITVRYFKEDTAHPEVPAVGNYITLTGKADRIDPVFRTMQMGNTVVRFEDLVEISFARQIIQCAINNILNAPVLAILSTTIE